MQSYLPHKLHEEGVKLSSSLNAQLFFQKGEGVKSHFFLGWQTHGHTISQILFKVWEVEDIWSLVKDVAFKKSVTLCYLRNKPTLFLPILGENMA